MSAALTGQRCAFKGCGQEYEHDIHYHYDDLSRTANGTPTHAFVAPPVAPAEPRTEPLTVWGDPLTFASDEADGRRLQLMQGGNGDWYVGVTQPDERFALHGVRISTSGGASFSHPGLTSAIAKAYRALWNKEFPAAAMAQDAEVTRLTATLATQARTLDALREKAAAYDRINTPEIDDFVSAVKNEALHQRERWGVRQDEEKTAADWFWLVGYLAGKALHDVKGKRVHHLITTAAALLNWHAQETGNWAAPTRCNVCSGVYGLTPRCPGCATD